MSDDPTETQRPEQACAAMCVNDIACDPDHEPWTQEECAMFCVDDLDTDDGVCKAEFVELWACVGALNCEAYIDFVYGPPPWPCMQEIDAIDSCEGG